jgi:hypothetical protein
MVLLAVKRLSPEERVEVEQAVAGARALFEPIDVRADPAVYSVLEDDGLTSEQHGQAPAG